MPRAAQKKTCCVDFFVIKIKLHVSEQWIFMVFPVMGINFKGNILPLSLVSCASNRTTEFSLHRHSIPLVHNRIFSLNNITHTCASSQHRCRQSVRSNANFGKIIFSDNNFAYKCETLSHPFTKCGIRLMAFVQWSNEIRFHKMHCY